MGCRGRPRCHHGQVDAGFPDSTAVLAPRRSWTTSVQSGRSAQAAHASQWPLGGGRTGIDHPLDEPHDLRAWDRRLVAVDRIRLGLRRSPTAGRLHITRRRDDSWRHANRGRPRRGLDDSCKRRHPSQWPLGGGRAWIDHPIDVPHDLRARDGDWWKWTGFGWAYVGPAIVKRRRTDHEPRDEVLAGAGAEAQKRHQRDAPVKAPALPQRWRACWRPGSGSRAVRSRPAGWRSPA